MTATVAIVGATASGKSAVALEVARALGGCEIVTVDSMQVYRGLDIGTAKPTPAEQAEVPHHLLDLVDVEEEFAVAPFVAAARDALDGIGARGHRALLVGGTGLYLRAIIDGLDLPGRFPETRAALAAEPDTASLHARLMELDPVAAARMTTSNRRRIERALEVTVGSGRPFSSYGPGLDAYPPSPIAQVGLDVPVAELDRRIDARVAAMLDGGLLTEARALEGRSLSRTAERALGYAELLEHLRGERSLEDAVAETVRRTRRLARRQLRWFRRDPRIRWAPPEAAVEVVIAALGSLRSRPIDHTS